MSGFRIFYWGPSNIIGDSPGLKIKKVVSLAIASQLSLYKSSGSNSHLTSLLFV